MDNTSLDSLPAGYMLGNYEIQKVLGRGGFGITYLAFDHDLNTQVAIKEFFPFGKTIRGDDMHLLLRSEDDAEMYTSQVERFVEEARALAQFNHQSIVSVRRLLESNDTAYFVMDFVKGGTLGEYIETYKKVSPNNVLKIARSLVDGLMVVHEAGLVHRDIKPDNILLPLIRGSKSGGEQSDIDLSRPILIDFGTARQTNVKHSATNYVSIGFAPFEQHSTRSVPDARSDIYSLCAVLYASLSGEVPADPTTRQLEPESLQPAETRFKGKLPLGFLAAIDHGLSILPNDRPNTMAELKIAMFGTSSPDASLSTAPKVQDKTKAVEKTTPQGARSAEKPNHQKTANNLQLPIIGGGILVLTIFSILGYVLFTGNETNVVKDDESISIAVSDQKWEPLDIGNIDTAQINSTGPFRIRNGSEIYLIEDLGNIGIPFSTKNNLEVKSLNGPITILIDSKNTSN